jgi:hypothetical protein
VMVLITLVVLGEVEKRFLDPARAE